MKYKYKFAPGMVDQFISAGAGRGNTDANTHIAETLGYETFTAFVENGCIIGVDGTDLADHYSPVFDEDEIARFLVLADLTVEVAEVKPVLMLEAIKELASKVDELQTTVAKLTESVEKMQ